MVEWKKLGEVCEKTSNIKWKDQTDDIIYKYIDLSSVSLDSHKVILTTDICKQNAPSRAQQVVNNNDILLGTTRPTLKRYCQIPSYLDNNICSTGFCIFRANKKYVLSRWLYHNIGSGKFWDYCELKQQGAGYPCLSNSDAFAYMIPVPPLSEQQRIVGILDTFTSSIENLKEQIAQRRKQYEYYRDQLLDLEGKEGVEVITLGEIGEFIRGNGIQKNDFVEEGFGCIHYGQIHARYGFSAEKTISKIEESLYKKCKKAKKGDIVLATTSEDAEGVAKPFVWLGDEEVAVSGDAFIFHHNQNGKFMGYQFLTHKFMQFKVKHATGAKVVRISGDSMAKYEVALPSLSEQQRIVSILDTFEASIQNLEQQLAQREKQYEYYRNKLLTFE
ncbi:restriction endonuclease subunit S [uncultured Prevotella sp.]|uniref:restriction endonuclease subunit S n=1 Tax=uncultured Prevotella sp. TaxID=159272 RepID=UPI0025F52C95|nr:restriction endonuclease subunit S [uncultured Prevotella sp.]